MNGLIHARVDGDGHLIEADPPLAALHARAGGAPGGVVAVPQLASLARLVRRLGIVVSRGIVAADSDADLDLWVRARPEGEGVAFTIAGWRRRPAAPPWPAPSSERDRDFLRASADWLWETDAALRLTEVSPVASAMLGNDAAALVGEALTRLFVLAAAEDGAMPILDALALQSRFDDQRAVVRGTEVQVRLSGVPLIDGGGRFAGFRGSVTRIEPEAATTSAPAPADAESEAFGRRLDSALRAPLDRIISNAEVIRAQEQGALRRDYAVYAADIAAAGRHLLALVDDLVDLQAIERPGFRLPVETIDLADVARRAAGLLKVRAADRNVRIDAPGAGETLAARGDFRRTLQILVNLIGNALRYSPEGGMVWIRCEQNGGAKVVVADQGKGIAIEDHARIFEKFERVDPSEPGGTGLGLYIARRIARAMGGDIAVDSAPGQGARFTLTLPPG